MDLINNYQFDEAMFFLQQQARIAGMPDFIDRVEVLRDEYSQVLNQFTEAKLDSEAEDTYNSLLLQFFDQVQKLCFKLVTPDYFNATKIQTFIHDFERDKSDYALCELFHAIMLSGPFSEKDRSTLHQLIMNEDFPVFMRCAVLSAVMLHLFTHFDTEMLENIYTYTLDDQPDMIRWQAWVTMFLCAVVHSTRIEHCDRIRQQYQFLAESEPDLFLSMQLTLLQCREVEGLHDKVMKMMSKKGDDEEKAKQMFSIVSEGADLSYDAFKMMRHMPFFASPNLSAHWLMPFSAEQEGIKVLLNQNPETRTVVELLSKSLAQSEQDKYGSILMLIGNNIKVIEQMNEQMKELGLEIDKVVAPSGEVLMRNYMHDVYRFFTLSMVGSSLPVSPFRENLNMGRISWLTAALGSPKALRILGDYMINHEDWENATGVYAHLAELENSEFALQRLGYVASKRQTRNMKLEGDSLIKCNKLFPGNTWTLLNLAKFYRRSSLFSAAIIHLQEALQIEPDNAELLTEIAECHMELQEYDRALETYFKLDLKNEGDVKIQRQIVKCAFLSHNIETAKKYIQLVLGQRKPIIADWALAGCIALKDDDIKGMLDYFSHIGNLRSRLTNFDNYIQLMTKAGIPEYLTTIARDALNEL